MLLKGGAHFKRKFNNNIFANTGVTYSMLYSIVDITKAYSVDQLG